MKDLLNPKNADIKIRESPQKGVWVDGLTEEVRLILLPYFSLSIFIFVLLYIFITSIIISLFLCASTNHDSYAVCN